MLRYDRLAAANGLAVNSLASDFCCGLLPLTSDSAEQQARELRTCRRPEKVLKFKLLHKSLGMRFSQIWRRPIRRTSPNFSELHCWTLFSEKCSQVFRCSPDAHTADPVQQIFGNRFREKIYQRNGFLTSRLLGERKFKQKINLIKVITSWID